MQLQWTNQNLQWNNQNNLEMWKSREEGQRHPSHIKVHYQTTAPKELKENFQIVVVPVRVDHQTVRGVLQRGITGENLEVEVGVDTHIPDVKGQDQGHVAGLDALTIATEEVGDVPGREAEIDVEQRHQVDRQAGRPHTNVVQEVVARKGGGDDRGQEVDKGSGQEVEAVATDRGRGHGRQDVIPGAEVANEGDVLDPLSDVREVETEDTDIPGHDHVPLL